MGETFKSWRYAFPTVSDPENMAARVMTFAPVSGAEALKLLRSSFPDCSLSERVAALNYLMRRQPRGSGGRHNPK
jgi:hypothetical protein